MNGVGTAWVFAVLLLQRLLELLLSRRNLRSLASRGGREFAPETFRNVAALHAFFLSSLAAESYPWRVPADPLTVGCLAALALLSALRYGCMAALGEHWNARIVVVPGAPARASGPYRFLRHPNYLAVTLEFLFLPLLLRAPLTLAVFFPANLLVLRQRIRLEERALASCTDYREKFPGAAPPG